MTLPQLMFVGRAIGVAKEMSMSISWSAGLLVSAD